VAFVVNDQGRLISPVETDLIAPDDRIENPVAGLLIHAIRSGYSVCKDYDV